jgi:hypothetical protein
MHFAIFKNGRIGSEGTYCIVGAASTISIFADRPTPSDEMHVTTSGGIIRSRLPCAGPLQICSIPRCP